MDKYFTPEISDIRVGYECEWYSKSEGWVKYTITGWDEFEQLGLDRMRVPYLTKEQIEAEGWQNDSSLLLMDVTDEKDLGDTLWYLFIKDQFKLVWTPNTNKISIVRNNLQLFVGTCKCINTFRTILKLINAE